MPMCTHPTFSRLVAHVVLSGSIISQARSRKCRPSAAAFSLPSESEGAAAEGTCSANGPRRQGSTSAKQTRGPSPRTCRWAWRERHATRCATRCGCHVPRGRLGAAAAPHLVHHTSICAMAGLHRLAAATGGSRSRGHAGQLSFQAAIGPLLQVACGCASAALAGGRHFLRRHCSCLSAHHRGGMHPASTGPSRVSRCAKKPTPPPACVAE